jgi:glyoxylase-like metal-dependent hydrolase (beta-lactamase superfamily II)
LAQPAVSPDLKVNTLGPQVELLSGQGPVSNMTLGWTGEEAVLVDTGLKEITPALVAELLQRNPSGRLTVINTHWHFDHVGSNAALGAAGAVILAQANVGHRMAKGGDADVGPQHFHADPVPKSGLPSRVYGEKTSLQLGDEEIVILHPPHAHTDGDSLVKWTKADVLNMGDVFFPRGFPILDVDAGGSLEGEIAAIDMGLGVCDSKTIVVPGHGKPLTCRDLVEYRDKLKAIASPLRQAIAEGKSLEQVQAMRLADGWKQERVLFSADDFIAMAYRGYSSSKSSN